MIWITFWSIYLLILNSHGLLVFCKYNIFWVLVFTEINMPKVVYFKLLPLWDIFWFCTIIWFNNFDWLRIARNPKLLPEIQFESNYGTTPKYCMSYYGTFKVQVCPHGLMQCWKIFQHICKRPYYMKAYKNTSMKEYNIEMSLIVMWNSEKEWF